ncbi:MAG: hypothetical protein J6N54_05925, partial [Bacteroidales bacterium]|nr:hypothetical protein [Bacteroidales bacterium]
MKSHISIILTIVIGIVGCNKFDEPVSPEDLIPRQPIPLTRSQQEFANNGNNAFALSLFKTLATTDKNMVISPLGVSFTLGMIDNGAVAYTKEEIENTLGYNSESTSDLNSFCKTILDNAKKIDPSTTIEIANAAVFNDRLLTLRDDYKKSLRNNYYTEVCSKDFKKDDVAGYINSWCKNNTHNTIPGILSSQPKDNTAVIFLNAIYFKGIWSSQFKKSNTRKEDFSDIYGQIHHVNMMRQESSFYYGRFEDLCSFVCLPFGNQAYSMLIILPDTSKSLSDLRSGLCVDMWNKMNKSQHNTKVDVKIPSFKAEYDASLKEVLQQLGCRSTFDPVSAQFGLMSKDHVWVDDVSQKAIIAID